MQIFAAADQGFSNEQIKGISVRPELIEILPAGKEKKTGNVFKGKIEEMNYQGEFVETRICLDGTSKIITAHVSTKTGQGVRLVRGEEVFASWEIESSNLLTD